MASLDIDTWVFDPAAPFDLFKVSRVRLDTFYRNTLITRALHRRIPQVDQEGTGLVRLSSGMRMEAPMLVMGLQLGDVRLPEARVLVVDSGDSELVLGSGLLQRALRIGGGDGAVIASREREAPGCLAVELHPLRRPFELMELERLIRGLRRLHALLVLVAAGGEPAVSLDGAPELEDRLAPEQRLRLRWLGHDPLWLTLEGGGAGPLRELAEVLPTGATARLAEQAAQAPSREVRTRILATERFGTMAMVRAEQEERGEERIQASFDAWVAEVPARLAGLDARIGEQPGRDHQENLAAFRDGALADLVGAGFLPLVRRLPEVPAP